MRASAAQVLVVAALACAAVVVAPAAVPIARADPCAPATLDAAQLDAVFASVDIGGGPRAPGYAGGDYPHAYPLPDGRVLWLFQDIFYSADEDLRDSLTAAAHNGGLVQRGTCFTRFGAPGRNAIAHERTQPLSRWFWPLDGELGHDGLLWIFLAEMHNPNGTGAGLGAVPVGTHIARLDPSSLEVVSITPAPDASASLYGWSIVSTDRYSYLYGHCYRQYVHDVDGPGQFDSSCMPKSYVARVPVGRFEMEPEYFAGTNAAGSVWSPRAADAVAYSHRSFANPVSVQWFGDVFVSVSKVSEWWGTTLEVDTAVAPEGPWTSYRRINVVSERKCDRCGNYGAFLLPWLDATGQMTIALSNGAPFELWYEDASLYRPTFHSVPLPPPVAGGAPSAASPSPWSDVAGTAGFVAVDPVRLLDTRDPGAPFARLQAGAVSTLDLRASMPAGAEAVALNLAATGAVADGWVRAWPCADTPPPTSSINPIAGITTANAAIVPVGDGRICFETLRGTELVVDLNGWLTSASAVGLAPVTPRRLVDTRTGLGGSPRLTAGQVLEVQVVDPAAARDLDEIDAVALNVTAVDPGATGFVTAWPCGTPMPVVANLNPERGITRPNAVNVRVGAGGRVCIYTLAATDLVVDLFGEYRRGAAARYGAVTPARLVDTRADDALRHPADTSTVVPVGDVVAAQLNVTAVGGPAAGYLTAFRCVDRVRPFVANVNHRAGEVSGNATLAPAGRGYTCIYPYAPAEIVVDLFGVWTTAR